MNFDKIKKYLQYYLDSVIVPKIKNTSEKGEDVKLTVYDILEGSYQPTIIHVFIHSDPESFVQKGKGNAPFPKYKKIESDIMDFFKLIPIDERIKIHWNTKPKVKKVMEL